MPIMEAGLTELLLYLPSPLTTPYVHPLPRSLLVSRTYSPSSYNQLRGLRVMLALDLLGLVALDPLLAPLA